MTQMRILTTLEWPSTWGAVAEDVGVTIDILPSSKSSAPNVFRVFGELFIAFRLWRQANRYDAVITGTHAHVALFGILQRLRPGVKPRHLLLECLWEQSGNPV